jgi:alpha-1,3-rhamnosyl/mannosyltransferase
MADSRYTADVVIEHLQVDPARVEVVPLGLDPRFQPPPPDRSRPAGRGPNVLMVAPWAPYKGYPEAMAVIDRLAEAGLPHELRIVGANDAWMTAQAEATRRSAGRPERVRLEGWVDDLRDAFWDADVVIVTSRYEGFGLPLLEAMGCGSAVVSFDNSSLPEVAGDGALLVADGDIDAMSEAVRELLHDDTARRDLGRRGVARAAGFTWEDSASTIADVLRSVAGRVRTR